MKNRINQFIKYSLQPDFSEAEESKIYLAALEEMLEGDINVIDKNGEVSSMSKTEYFCRQLYNIALGFKEEFKKDDIDAIGAIIQLQETGLDAEHFHFLKRIIQRLFKQKEFTL